MCNLDLSLSMLDFTGLNIMTSRQREGGPIRPRGQERGAQADEQGQQEDVRQG